MKKKKKSTLFALFCLCVVKMGAQELTLEERLTKIEQELRRQAEKQKFMPQIHGILRGKYEYEPDLNASRFEVRNARFSLETPCGLILYVGGEKLLPIAVFLKCYAKIAKFSELQAMIA